MESLRGWHQWYKRVLALLKLVTMCNAFYDIWHELCDGYSEQMWCDMNQLYGVAWYKWPIIWIGHDMKYTMNVENDRFVSYRCEYSSKTVKC